MKQPHNIEKPSSKLTERRYILGFCSPKPHPVESIQTIEYSESKICEGENLVTFPKIGGINMVRTRLLHNCLVGKVTPTPLATNFVMDNGT